MANVHFDSGLPDDVKRRMLYAGDIFVYSPTTSSLSLCDLAYDLLRDAFAPLDPEVAQYELPVEKFVEILAAVKPEFIHHPECKKLLPQIISDSGCETLKSFFDLPRIRTSTSDGYLTSGIAYAFHPHRDTWYSAPQCQINWWMPVKTLSADNCMAFYPRYFDAGVKNSSKHYNYYRWNAESRRDAAKQIGKDSRQQPMPEEPIELEPDLRIVPEIGGLIAFSGAHMHASVANNTGRTRLSIDFRTIHVDDARNQIGAPNVDSQCTGTTLRDFLCCADLQMLPQDVIRRHDDAEIPDDLVAVYDPARK